MFRAIKRVCHEHGNIKVIYPIHLNPAVRETAGEILKNEDRIELIEPFIVIDFDRFRKYPERSPKPRQVLIMRDTTERPEVLKWVSV